MANKTIQSRIILRNDLAATWVEKNPVLLKGEIGVEIDTSKFKFGDSTTAWNDLSYGSTPEYQLSVATETVLGGVKSQAAGTDKVVVAADGTMSVSKVTNAINAENAVTAEGADKLNTARTISLSGDATGSTTFDGTENKAISVALAETGVTAGTYPKVTVDAKGRVTAGASLEVTDIPDLTLAKITDAGTAASKDVGTAEGNVPLLGADGKLDTAVLPALAISETFTVEKEADMLALTAQKGDVAICTVGNNGPQTYILAGDDATVAENWKPIAHPADAVSSVNGKTGAVTLTTDDVTEGATKQYFTEERATANFESNIAQTASTELTDSANIVYADDVLILDGGSAE